ncbi:MAG: hypothetical protein ACHQAY_19830 [Hyphomicrobiales bacterium]
MTDPSAVPAGLRRTMRIAAGLTVLGCVISFAIRTAVIPSHFGTPTSVWLASLLFRTQDGAWLVAGALLLLVLSALRIPAAFSGWDRLHPRPWLTTSVLAGLTLAATLAGTFLVFGNFHFSRDEFLADFDSVIFRSGRLIADLPTEWRPFARALGPDFMLPIPGNAGWISAYLPVNAAFRALIGLILDPAFASPVLACIAVIALFGIARRLWPGRLDAAFVAVTLLVTSSQFLVTAMTSYAMTAHLAFNLLWLWLYLRDDRLSHAGAIGVGFLATGLHQLLFHPLFAAPFIARLWWIGRRRPALLYIVAYAAICIFWMLYWQLVLSVHGVAPDDAETTGPALFIVRAMRFLRDFSWDGTGLMLKNVLRFIAWQNLIALPLALAAWTAIRRGEGLARPLIGGLLLTIAAMFIILPYQGHGWGYRYLHGLLGSFCLLAGYGWMAVTARASHREIAAGRASLAMTSAIAVAIMLPLHAFQAGGLVAPYRKAVAAIEGAPVGIVIVDRSGLLFAGDLVRNDPFLRNQPKMLDLTYLDENRVADICKRFTVAVFDRRQAVALGIPQDDTLPKLDEEARARLRAYMAGLSCGTDLVIAPASAPAS